MFITFFVEDKIPYILVPIPALDLPFYAFYGNLKSEKEPNLLLGFRKFYCPQSLDITRQRRIVNILPEINTTGLKGLKYRESIWSKWNLDKNSSSDYSRSQYTSISINDNADEK